MAQFVVRNLEDDVVAKLKRRAKRLGSRIAWRFRRGGLTGDLPEWHGVGDCARLPRFVS